MAALPARRQIDLTSGKRTTSFTGGAVGTPSSPVSGSAARLKRGALYLIVTESVDHAFLGAW